MLKSLRRSKNKNNILKMKKYNLSFMIKAKVEELEQIKEAMDSA